METEKDLEPLVTEVRVQITREPPILAFVSVTLWNAFVVHDLRILRRRDGTRVVLMPRLQSPDGSWNPAAHPIQERTRLEIESSVLRAYDELVAHEQQATA
jgi:DNA-binding cell septation regulator SpoVG